MNVNKGDVFEEILEFLCFNEGKFEFGEREIRDLYLGFLKL